MLQRRLSGHLLCEGCPLNMPVLGSAYFIDFQERCFFNLGHANNNVFYEVIKAFRVTIGVLERVMHFG